ncbi:hypothetical protein J2X06_001226 [Lysobacter niastensis]|uniref:Uncharacterized protein n=1 Tax=Lysobacter niastensis TaxID=380629 RepID=A0ABU1W9A2_9GAMM|nr:hypothetical protein [Lysobacter niastensis]MDR7134042.1 hypothetical protein [Lysobacter niastensis]
MLRKISYLEQIERAISEAEGTIKEHWEKGPELLEGAAIEIGVDLDMFEMDSLALPDPDAEAFVFRGYFERFEAFLATAGFPGWNPIGSDLDYLTKQELSLAYGLVLVEAAQWSVAAIKQGEAERWGALVLTMTALGKLLVVGVGGGTNTEPPRKNLAQLGGLARGRKYGPIKAFAIRKYQERTWKSPLQAARKIWREVFDEAMSREVPMSELRAEQTVYEWLLAYTGAGTRTR